MLPTDAKERKTYKLYTFLREYFPDAFIELARMSYLANAQHNPGQPMHWAREKSSDHEDCLMRHLMQLGEIDNDGIRHSSKVAWRALAALQLELESAAADSDVVTPASPTYGLPVGSVSTGERIQAGYTHYVNCVAIAVDKAE